VCSLQFLIPKTVHYDEVSSTVEEHRMAKFRYNFVFMSIYHCVIRNRDNAVGIATGYGAVRTRGRSSSLGRVKNFICFMSSCLWGPLSLLSNGYRW
jgi:hypothetical protein